MRAAGRGALLLLAGCAVNAAAAPAGQTPFGAIGGSVKGDAALGVPMQIIILLTVRVLKQDDKLAEASRKAMNDVERYRTIIAKLGLRR